MSVSYSQYLEIPETVFDQILISCEHRKSAVSTLRKIVETNKAINENQERTIELQALSLADRDALIMEANETVATLNNNLIKSEKRRKKAKLWSWLLGFFTGGIAGYGVSTL